MIISYNPKHRLLTLGETFQMEGQPRASKPRDWKIFLILPLMSHVAFKKIFFSFILAAPRSMQDLSSPTRDRTHAPCSGIGES